MTASNDNYNEDDSMDCPVCCNPLGIADQRYPLHCPTTECDFNYCAACIERFLQAAADGYQEASDGSHQVKIEVKCPSCRAKYELKNIKYPSELIIQSVLTLRKATVMEGFLQAKYDSELTASELTKRQAFLRDMSMEELEDAFARLQVYQDSLPKLQPHQDGYELTLIPLNWEKYRAILPAKKQSSSSSSQQQQQQQQQQKTKNNTTNATNNNNSNTADTVADTFVWKDPTLFGGLGELLTAAEHEFITNMMISGKPEMLAQAATILHGVTEMAMASRAQTTIQQLGSFTTTNTTTTTTTTQRRAASDRPVRYSKNTSDHMDRVRKRFPLPLHMPRCVTLDPTQLQFQKDTLTLNSVRGPAGRLGLRKGDTVTHVDGNAVETYEQYIQAEGDQITVNANETIAQELAKRAEDMKAQKIRFYY